ncbi:hypothetical protein DIPPA_10441 [Diplonema papillatum]|nr:hypothetical protein DIPPA_10441 [Diplonema papillatum]
MTSHLCTDGVVAQLSQLEEARQVAEGAKKEAQALRAAGRRVADIASRDLRHDDGGHNELLDAVDSLGATVVAAKSPPPAAVTTRAFPPLAYTGSRLAGMARRLSAKTAECTALAQQHATL